MSDDDKLSGAMIMASWFLFLYIGLMCLSWMTTDIPVRLDELPWVIGVWVLIRLTTWGCKED